MVIEISKKNLFLVSVVMIVAAGLFYSAYTLGFNNGYDKAISDTENKKGNGVNFYAEEKTGTRANLLGPMLLMILLCIIQFLIARL